MGVQYPGLMTPKEPPRPMFLFKIPGKVFHLYFSRITFCNCRKNKFGNNVLNLQHPSEQGGFSTLAGLLRNGSRRIEQRPVKVPDLTRLVQNKTHPINRLNHKR